MNSRLIVSMNLFFQIYWLCVICRKKQELLAKTGSWFHGKESKAKSTIEEIEAELHTPPTQSPIHRKLKNSELNKPIKSALSPIIIRKNRPDNGNRSVLKPGNESIYSGGSSPEVTKPILVHTKSIDSSEIISSKRQGRDYRSDNSDSSSISGDVPSKKKTVTFGENDLIHTHDEYIQDVEKQNGMEPKRIIHDENDNGQVRSLFTKF